MDRLVVLLEQQRHEATGTEMRLASRLQWGVQMLQRRADDGARRAILSAWRCCLVLCSVGQTELVSSAVHLSNETWMILSITGNKIHFTAQDYELLGLCHARLSCLAEFGGRAGARCEVAHRHQMHMMVDGQKARNCERRLRGAFGTWAAWACERARRHAVARHAARRLAQNRAGAALHAWATATLSHYGQSGYATPEQARARSA